PGVADRLAAAWLSAVRSRDPAAASAGFTAEAVGVLGEPADGDLVRLGRELVAALAADPAAPRCPVTVGISRVVEGVAALPDAYEQARTAVRVGRQLHGPGGVAHFDGLGVYRLLGLVPDGAELRTFATETLGELADPTDPDAEDLRRTLQVLLETNLNVAETARRLHFHYNTLRYRIGKLERIVGPFTVDPHLRLSLSLALLVVQMRGV
ncbi:MAG: PucR family transcriptional regulator, partial [Actinomycetes bacterium]